MDLAPILPASGPFFRNIHHRKIQHFQQTVIRGEYGLGFGYLPQLAVKALNGVGGIDQPAYFLRKFEVGAQIGPVLSPGFGNLRMFLIPASGKGLQSVL